MRHIWLSIVEHTHAPIDWAETHAGLGDWVGAIGAIVAIFVTWGLARAEYLRAGRLEAGRVNAEIALFIRITSDFQPIVVGYLQLVENHDPAAIDYYTKQQDDARWLNCVDLNWMSITQWPSVDSYDAFKRYFLASTRLMETPPKEEARVEARKKAYEGTFETLQKALKTARR